MAIDPVVVPNSSNEGEHAVRFIPRWTIYLIAGVSVLLVISLVKAFLPLLVMGILLTFIWRQSTK